MDASLTYTRYRNDLSVGTILNSTSSFGKESTDIELGANSGISDLTAKVDMSWNPSTEHKVRYGASWTGHTFRPDVMVARMSMSADFTDPDSGAVIDTLIEMDEMIGEKIVRAHELVAYAEDEISYDDWLQANVGLSYSGFAVQGKYYHSLQPRVSARALLADNLSVKLGYAYMTQYVHLLMNNAISLPSDLWVPVTERIKPMSSSQVAAGVFYDIPGLFDISVEAYYKDMNNLMEYRDGASLMATTSGWEDKVCLGRGWAYGVELLLQRSVGRTTGWIGYTWSKSMRLFDRPGEEINGGRPFPAKYDRRHDISITIAHKLTDNIDISATWVYNTGNCATLAMQYFQSMPGEMLPAGGYYYGDNLSHVPSRNNYRYDPYHRLDLGVNFHKQKRYGVRTWNISIYNAYNNMNPFIMYPTEEAVHNYDGQGNLSVSWRKKFVKLTIFPIIPSLTYSYKF
jgi:outer membrane receptor protein involved in Fe transport